MKKISVFTILLLTTLLMSACSRLPQRASNHRTPAYQSAHRQQAPAYQTRRPQVRQPVQRRYQTAKPRPARPSRHISQQNSRVSQVPRQSPVAPYNPVRQRMIDVAKSTLGTPYKWGGNNPRQGFDCSGLMSFVHKNSGLRIPRTTAQQRDRSRTVSYAQLQPGDMLFFKTGKRTNHVGVYIGNRKFIHAPSSGKRVTVASMDSSYWFKRFVKFGTFL